MAHAPNVPVALGDSVEILANRLGARQIADRGHHVIEKVDLAMHDLAGLRVLRGGLDVNEFAFDGHVGVAAQKHGGRVAEGLVVEIAAIAKRALGKLGLHRIARLRWPGLRAEIFAVEVFPVGVLDVGAVIGMLVQAEMPRDAGHRLEPHGFEGEGERRSAARGEREEGIVGLHEVIPIRARGAGDLVAEVEDVPMARFPYRGVGELDRHHEAADVGGGDEKIQFVDERRWLEESRRGAARTFALHRVERPEQDVIHPLAVEQRGLRFGDGQTGQVGDGFGVVEQAREISFVEPELLEPLHGFVVGECLREEDAVDPTRRRAGNHIHHETHADRVIFLLVSRRPRAAAVIPEVLGKLPIHSLRAAQLGSGQKACGSGRFGVGLRRSGRGDEGQQFLRDPIDVNRQRDSAIHDDCVPNLEFGIVENGWRRSRRGRVWGSAHGMGRIRGKD